MVNVDMAYCKVARLSNARTGISPYPVKYLLFSRGTRASLWRLTATSGILTMILNLVLTPRGWLQERLDFQPRWLRTNNARPIFLRFSTFIIHTFMRRCIDLCIKILTGNTVSREFHESHHRRVNGLLTVFAKQFCPHAVNKRVNKTCLGIYEKLTTNMLKDSQKTWFEWLKNYN